MKVRTIPREVGNLMLEFTARKNQTLFITDRQASIIVGCLLGDGYIHPKGQIQIAHSDKQQKYVEWKYEELKPISYGPPTKVSKFDRRYRKTYTQVRFWLRQYFRPWRKIFYPNGVKIVPKQIWKYFNDLSLAVWYMDDGNFSEGRNVKIATDGFDNKSRKEILEMLNN